ncbi:MAG: VOC family protein [archaeon]
MTTIVHFEIPADDVERAKKFYSELFGWKIEKAPGPMDYWMIETTNEKGEKALGGGLMKRPNPESKISNYIGVSSVDEHTKKIEAAGGKTLVQKTAVPGTGYWAMFLDTENNVFAIFEENKNAK